MKINFFKKYGVLFFVLIMIAASLSGCNQSNASKETKQEENPKEKTEQEKETTRIFTDSAGREVEIPKNITKIAPSGTLAQIVLYTIAPDKLIGWAKEPPQSMEKYYDNKYLDLPTFGMFYGDTFNLEALIDAKPDVIIDIGEAKKSVVEDMDEIQRTTGVPTIFIEAKLETIPQAYVTLGDILSEEEQGKALAKYSEDTLSDAKKFAASIPENERVKLYYGMGETGMNTNGKGSFHAEIIDFVGAENVAVLDKAASKGGGNEVSMEQLLLWQPDVMIFAQGSVYEQVSAGDSLWKDLKAAQNGQVYEIPEGPYNWMSFPPSVNRILGIKWLGNLIYPELYQYDMIKEAKTFYKLFYHYNLTDEEAKELLSRS